MNDTADNSEFVCPECGSKDFEETWQAPSYLISCVNCSWSVATTRFPDIYYDETVYELFIIPNNTRLFDEISIIKHYRGSNTAEARLQLKNEKVFILKDKALEIMKVIFTLNEKHIDYYISPDYNYTRDDLKGMII